MTDRHAHAIKRIIDGLREDGVTDFDIGFFLFGAAVSMLAKDGEPVDKLNEILHELHFEACCDSDCAN